MYIYVHVYTYIFILLWYEHCAQTHAIDSHMMKSKVIKLICLIAVRIYTVEGRPNNAWR